VHLTYLNRLEWVGLIAGVLAVTAMLSGCAMTPPDDPDPGQTLDADSDGVADEDDECPDTAANAAVDETGCSAAQRDSDEDGVVDAEDTCPGTPAGEPVDDEGCTEGQANPDSDGDGVPDANDECPDTPDGTSIDQDGCPQSAPGTPDADGDGVGDDVDLCPDTPTGEDADGNGCADSQKDGDNDGLTDDVDACPDTPSRDTDAVDEAGCGPSERDSDGDSVIDEDDECPNSAPGTEVDETGCPPDDGGDNGDGDGDNGGGDDPVCGNGQIEAGEECEPPGTDDCDDNCQIPEPVCGNEVVEDGEQCDPPGTDGCDDTCRLPESTSADACANAFGIQGEGLFGFDNSAATLDGPGHADCVAPANENNFEDNMDADVWACWTAPCSGTAFIDTCGQTTVDTKIAVYRGCDCPVTDAALADCNDDDCEFQSRVSFDVESGQQYLVRIGAFPNTALGVGGFSIACGLDACETSEDSCTEQHAGVGCSDGDCCETICALDAFCCDPNGGSWDENCVAEAVGLCTTDGFETCGERTSGSCSASDGTRSPGCADGDCCNIVCAIDPFCCLTEWDAACAQEAAQYCRTSCGQGAGDCFTIHDSPGCDSPECCAEVCTRDPICCGATDESGVAGTWDDLCVSSAEQFCNP